VKHGAPPADLAGLMSRTILRTVACLTSLGATLSLTLGGTVSAYTASVTTASSEPAGLASPRVADVLF
jgi:hypothetical protein